MSNSVWNAVGPRVQRFSPENHVSLFGLGFQVKTIASRREPRPMAGKNLQPVPHRERPKDQRGISFHLKTKGAPIRLRSWIGSILMPGVCPQGQLMCEATGFHLKTNCVWRWEPPHNHAASRCCLARKRPLSENSPASAFCVRRRRYAAGLRIASPRSMIHRTLIAAVTTPMLRRA